jgi:hypothetical protein
MFNSLFWNGIMGEVDRHILGSADALMMIQFSRS